MNKPAKALLGLVTLAPWVYFVYFISLIFKFLDASTIAESDAIFKQLLVPHVTTMVLAIVLLVIYIRHILKNKTLSSEKQLIWVLLILFGNLVAMPIYWCLYIWKTPTVTPV